MRYDEGGRVIQMIGLNDEDGLGHIIPYLTRPDMGNYGCADALPVHFEHNSKDYGFSYSNPKTGNVVYRENLIQKTNLH